MIALFVTIIGHYYLYLRLIFPLFGNNSIWITTFICLWGITFFGFIILRIVPHFLRKIFEVFMFIWMGVAFLFIIICLITSPINLFIKFMGYDQLYLCYFVIFSGILLTIYSMYLALKTPEIINVKISIKKILPKAIKNIKVVVLSDIHVSGLIGRKK